MSQCRLRVVLQVNRCLFNTSTISFPGNHDPVKLPMGASLRLTSTLLLQLPYETDRARKPSEQFKVRPHSANQFDFKARLQKLAREITRRS
jgi:hypothetical protein